MLRSWHCIDDHFCVVRRWHQFDCIHKYMQTTYKHACRRISHIYAYMYTCTHACIQVCMRILIPKCITPYIRTNEHTHIHTNNKAYMHTHMQTIKHAKKCVRTCTHPVTQGHDIYMIHICLCISYSYNIQVFIHRYPCVFHIQLHIT